MFSLDDAVLTTKEACELLKVNRKTLYRFITTSDLPYYRLPNGHLRFNVSDLSAWMATRGRTGGQG